MTTKKKKVSTEFSPSRDRAVGPGSELLAACPDPACCAGSVRVRDSEVLRLLKSCHYVSQRSPLALAALPVFSLGRAAAAAPAQSRLLRLARAGTRMVLGSSGGPMNILMPHNRWKRDSVGPL